MTEVQKDSLFFLKLKWACMSFYLRAFSCI